MTESRRRIAVVVGTGEHADPWHALESTATAVAHILSPLGSVETFTTDEIESCTGSDLLVLVVSSDLADAPPSSVQQVDVIEGHHRAGRPILALHTSSIAFRSDPRWPRILGGRWVPGVSMHPQIGHALVQATPRSEVPAGLVGFAGDFILYDERYSFLELEADVTVLAHHTEDGRTHGLVWGRPAGSEGGAVVYDGLGHGVESYASPEHAAWLRETATALLGSKPRRESVA